MLVQNLYKDRHTTLMRIMVLSLDYHDCASAKIYNCECNLYLTSKIDKISNAQIRNCNTTADFKKCNFIKFSIR